MSNEGGFNGFTRKPLSRMKAEIVGSVGRDRMRVKVLEGHGKGEEVVVKTPIPDWFKKGEVFEFDVKGASLGKRGSQDAALLVDVVVPEKSEMAREVERDIPEPEHTEAEPADATEEERREALQAFEEAVEAPKSHVPETISRFGFEGRGKLGRRPRVIGTLREDAEGKRYMVDEHDNVLFHEDDAPHAKYLAGDVPLNGPNLAVGVKIVFETLGADKDARDTKWQQIDILGPEGELQTELAVTTYEIGADRVFPHDVQEEVDALRARGEKAIIQEEVDKGVESALKSGWQEKYRPGENRIDFRKVETFTIDPHDAKDFDDALSYRVLLDGNVEIGVHISDVAHVVTPGTASFREALMRGTSVYLPGTVAPMLHEFFSGGTDSEGVKHDGLLSLVEKQDRLASSVVFTFSPEGQLIGEPWKGKSVIHSQKRFSYEEAHDVLKGKKASPHRDALRGLEKYAKIMRTHRRNRGEVEFFREPELRAQTQADGTLTLLHKYEIETNRMVADFMIAANEAMGRRLRDAQAKEGIPGFFRVHQAPDIADLKDAAKILGEKKIVEFIEDALKKERDPNISRKLVGKKLANVVMNMLVQSMRLPRGAIENIRKGVYDRHKGNFEVAEKEAEALVEEAALHRRETRMEVLGELLYKAVFSTTNIGHFGLGANDYSQFTSPMRRFGDLIVEMLDMERQYREHGRMVETYNEATLKELEEIADYLIRCEKRAKDAERTAKDMVLTERLKESVGKVLPVRVTGLVYNRASKEAIGVRIRLRVPNTDAHVRSRIMFEDAVGFPTTPAEIALLREKRDVPVELLEVDSVGRRVRVKLLGT